MSFCPPSVRQSLPCSSAGCGGEEKLPNQSALWLSERSFFHYFACHNFLLSKGTSDARHPPRNCGQYYLFPSGNNSRDCSSVKLMWIKVTIPWASWLACLGERGEVL